VRWSLINQYEVTGWSAFEVVIFGISGDSGTRQEGYPERSHEGILRGTLRGYLIPSEPRRSHDDRKCRDLVGSKHLTPGCRGPR
jgi:hypothetical protein